jgi:hypothetical protein
MSREQEKQAGCLRQDRIKEALDQNLQEMQRLAMFYQQHREASRATEILKTIKRMRDKDREHAA